MSTQKDIIEFGKTKFNQWRAIMEEMEVQLALGKAEARETIQDEKKKVTKFINQQKAQMQQVEKKSAEHQQTFADKIRELQFALSDFAPTSKDVFDTGRKKILHTIHEVEFQARTVFSEADESTKFMLSNLKNVLDAYRIELALSEFNAEKLAFEHKEALMNQLAKLITHLNRQNVEGDGKVEQFMDEISESFTHLKRAFSEVLS